ncbi:MAG: hypothetical protein MJ016_02380 [Victivallaceae bacterium]|nr:hypothetical protein [Victivallaceae bacterium]
MTGADDSIKPEELLRDLKQSRREFERGMKDFKVFVRKAHLAERMKKYCEKHKKCGAGQLWEKMIRW